MEVQVFTVVTATDETGAVVYERWHEYHDDARNDYGMVVRIFSDCTVTMEEKEG